MGVFLIVSKCDNLEEHAQISERYNVSFEINDFFYPEILDNSEKKREIIDKYKNRGIPANSTMHGAFFDVSLYSLDADVMKISYTRLKQSMDIARELGLRGVVFHTNYNPRLSNEAYDKSFVDSAVMCLARLLEKYKDIDIYLENMFDENPKILSLIAKELKAYSNFGVCLDWAHAGLYGGDVVQWVEELHEYIKHIHINDNDNVRDLHLPVGAGVIDWNVFKVYYERYFKDCSILIETNMPTDQISSLDYLQDLVSGNISADVNGSLNRKLSDTEMLEKIFYYMNCLVAERDFKESVMILTELGKTLVESDRASFWYRDVKKGQYWTIGATGEDKITIPMGTGIVGASIENNETILIDKPYEDPRFNSQVDKETGYVTKSLMCMPVTNTYGEIIGAYQAVNKIGDIPFDEQDVKYMALAAAYCGNILETQLLKEQNNIDQLTGLKNRRGFYDIYDNKMAKIVKEKPCSIIMCDIDFFKKVNDTYGHNVGDAVLVHIADMLSKHTDSVGEVFRWGGEEFIILLPDMDMNQAVSLAELLRKKVEDSECYSENHIVKVTMSFGVSSLVESRTSQENVKVADDKLYRAKQEGRNRVISYETE